MADSQEQATASISTQPDLQISVQSSSNTITRTPCIRNSHGLSADEPLKTWPERLYFEGIREQYTQQEDAVIQQRDIYNQEWDAFFQKWNIYIQKCDAMIQLEDIVFQQGDIVFQSGDTVIQQFELLQGQNAPIQPQDTLIQRHNVLNQGQDTPIHREDIHEDPMNFSKIGNVPSNKKRIFNPRRSAGPRMIFPQSKYSPCFVSIGIN